MAETEKPFNVRWGILATGGIATTFSKDLLTSPSTRSVHDISHTIVAAASSSSVSRASQFLQSISAPASAVPYGSYHALVADPNVDVVYIATPHSHHFQNAMLCLSAGKNVLCEKAFTVNAEQTRLLIEKAREKGCFLMEAVWTRYFPLSVKVREMVKDGVLGKVERVWADLSCNETIEGNSHGKEGKGEEKGEGEIGRLRFPDESRAVNLDLAGGALLDLGIYSLTWVFQILYLCQPPSSSGEKEKPKVLAQIQKYKTGADESVSILLQWAENRTMGIATSGFKVSTQPHGDESLVSGPTCRIQGTKGEIQILGPLYKPTMYRVIMRGGKKGEVEDVHCPIPKDKDRDGWGQGMFWEADEVGRCLRDGKKQSEVLGWEESLVIMETMDEARRQGGLKYPDEIESTVYDENSPLNRSGR